MGPLIWRKTLSRTDAQHQSGNITGDLRLVQAKKDNSRHINQTTHFRNNVFGALKWTAENKSETAEADFDVTICGRAYGVRTLTLSHKPSGEANQHNYTTNIRWGSLQALGDILHKTDVSGHMFHLYAPIAGSTTFFIVVD